MTPLILVVLLLVALHHWLVMPLLLASTWLLELKPLPWLLLAGLKPAMKKPPARAGGGGRPSKRARG